MIIEYIEQNRDRRFRAAEIYSYLLEQGQQVNLTTIYRNLDKLEENKLLMKYKTPRLYFGIKAEHSNNVAFIVSD